MRSYHILPNWYSLVFLLFLARIVVVTKHSIRSNFASSSCTNVYLAISTLQVTDSTTSGLLNRTSWIIDDCCFFPLSQRRVLRSLSAPALPLGPLSLSRRAISRKLRRPPPQSQLMNIVDCCFCALSLSPSLSLSLSPSLSLSGYLSRRLPALSGSGYLSPRLSA